MKQKRTRCCARGVYLFLAALMCVVLPMLAWAEETEPSDQTQQPTEVVKTASNEELVTACVALQPLLQGDEMELYQRVNWNAVTGDNALHAVQLSAEAIEEKQRLTSSVQTVKETVKNSAILEETQKQNYLSNLDRMEESLDQTPWKDLLEALADDPSAPISTEGLETYLTSTAQTDTTIGSFSEVLGLLQNLQQTNEQASLAVEYLGDAEQMANTCEELKQRAQTLLEKAYVFFSLPLEEQQVLAEQIGDLSGDVNALYTDITVASAQKANQLQEQSNQMKDRIVLLYVALGVGGLAVIISILAVILALAKRPESQEMDMSLLASRNDVEALNDQNRRLSQDIDRQNRRLDETAAQQNARIDNLEVRLQETQRTAQKVKIGERDVLQIPPKSTLSEPQRIGYLKLLYNSFSPENSFLTKCEEPTCYVLYDDNSVLFADAQAGAISTLVAKKSEGLFYLFRPVVDGVELDAGDCEKYHEYFRLGTVKRRAKVRQNMGGNYACAEKGAIEMVRM